MLGGQCDEERRKDLNGALGLDGAINSMEMREVEQKNCHNEGFDA